MLVRSALAQNETVSTNSTIEINDNKSRYRYSTSSNGTEFNIELRGKIEVTDDDRDIKSLSDDGYLEISKTVFGSKRTIKIESLGGGKMKKEYYEGRSLSSWENGKTWLGEILPEVVRSTGISAESRLNRYYKQGGTSAALAEIERLENDAVRIQYANMLMKKPLQPSEYITVLKSITDKVDSDHYKAEFLKTNIAKFLQTKESTTAVFAATNDIDSDHYKTVVIKEALLGSSATPENVAVILQSAARIESDHYITDVLLSLLKQPSFNDATLAELINTTKAIESDHYRTEVLTKALDKPGISKASYQRVVESIKDIESDHYLTQVINHLLRNKLTPEILTATFSIISTIESDHYRSDVLNNLFQKQGLTDSQFTSVLNLVGSIGSDHYKSTVLTRAASGSLSESQLIQVIQVTKRIVYNGS
jgi:hypothetical protein